MKCPVCGKLVKMIKTNKGSNILIDSGQLQVWVRDADNPGTYRTTGVNQGHNNTCLGKKSRIFSARGKRV